MLLVSPCRLPVDSVLRLREAVAPSRLRSWLMEQVSNASQRLVLTEPVLSLLAEFNELTTVAVERSKEGLLFKVVFGGVAAAIGTIAGDLPGALVGTVAGGGAGEAADRANLAWSRRYRDFGWVLRLHEFRSEVRRVRKTREP